jgi:NitT/TauT family transport system ATP-binding protein
MPIVDVRNLVKSFSSAQRSVTAIENINFSIDAGKFATVVGPSGCGKSTLLMMIGGLVTATSGEVRVNGEIMTGPRPDLIGMVFQDATLLPWKTALGNVEFPLQLRGVDAQSRQSRAHELLSLVGLTNFAGHFPHELSGGMRQRVGIARGLARDPTILLMDEPFSALDEQNRTRMGKELLRIWEVTRKTVLFITHSLTEAVYLSDVIFVMSASPGRIVETIEVDIPRPRALDVIDAVEFGRIRNRIWHLIAEAET